jgi:hypothetical protein
MMRKGIVLAITILAGTHIAQGYYGHAWDPRFLPRAQRNPNYDRPDRDYEPGIVTPYRHRFDQDYREWRSMEPYRRYPPRRQGWDEED